MCNPLNIVMGQMRRLEMSGLSNAATSITIGVNGGQESEAIVRSIIPERANLVLHGLESRCENPTLVLLEEWLKTHSEEAYVLYFHAKGSSHDPLSRYGRYDNRWRECMMRSCIDNWRRCVNDLANVESVGCHWLTGQGPDRSQHYFAGTFFWGRASFLRTLPSIRNRDRIRLSGIASAESRYEAEVWIGNGKRLPTIVDYHPGDPSHFHYDY